MITRRKKKIFDLYKSPPCRSLGIFSQYIYNNHNFVRSKNPITSLAAVGHLANEICKKSNSRPYGIGSAWDKLTNFNSSILFLGVPLSSSLTYAHYIEFFAGVPHMYIKKFNIPIKQNGKIIEKKALAYVRYLDFNIKVRYLHSDINTIERVEIIRDLREGEFDVLVGINLLREGLDLPEVELVAILDADKEGFLRSERSLIQTIGRAARNIKGRVILYGDDMTGSMKKAIDETDRRRKIQMNFNEENGIKPQGIKKAIKEYLDEDVYLSNKHLDKVTYISEVKKRFPKVKESNVHLIIKKLENQMFRCAKDLEFEKAAELRDQISAMQENFLDMPKINKKNINE